MMPTWSMTCYSLQASATPTTPTCLIDYKQCCVVLLCCAWLQCTLSHSPGPSNVMQHLTCLLCHATTSSVLQGNTCSVESRYSSCCTMQTRLSYHAAPSGVLPAGSKGVGQIFAKVPQIMLCKPSTNDRWDRRVVQLAAFMHRHGHCNVPEVCPQPSTHIHSMQ